MNGLAGFWRRLFAWSIDGFLLGVIGGISAIFLYGVYVEMGPYGRLVGFVVSVLYFGIMSSRLCDGQTLGKRWLGIKVVRRDGTTMSLSRSFLRFAVFGTCYFMNGAAISPTAMEYPIFYGILFSFIFGGLVAIPYLFIFNRRTRQSLHDLVADTLVVQTHAGVSNKDERIWKGHVVLVSCIFASLLTGAVLSKRYIEGHTDVKGLLSVVKAIAASDKVYGLSIMDQTTSFYTTKTGRSKQRYYQVSGTWQMGGREPNEVALNAVKILIKDSPACLERDKIVVTVRSGYDIGISSGFRSTPVSHTPQEWLELLGEK